MDSGDLLMANTFSIPFVFFSQLVMQKTDMFQLVLSKNWEKGMTIFHLGARSGRNWLSWPHLLRYCQSKLAQVLKTRGYAQEAEQLLQRVVRGGQMRV